MFVHYILVWDYFMNIEGVDLGPGGAHFAPRRGKIRPPRAQNYPLNIQKIISHQYVMYKHEYSF